MVAAVIGEGMGREKADSLTLVQNARRCVKKEREKRVLKTQDSVLGKMGV